jgi:hypothetical protein
MPVLTEIPLCLCGFVGRSFANRRQSDCRRDRPKIDGKARLGKHSLFL